MASESNALLPDECDVVVVGSGGGALVAALAAVAAGLDTVVVEKASRFGGTSAWSGGACWLPGSQVQQRDGVEDSIDSARTYLTAVLGPTATTEHERLEAFLGTAPDVVDFLEGHNDIAFTFQPFPDYFDAPGSRAHGRSIVPRDLDLTALGPLADRLRRRVDLDRADADHADPLVGGRALIGRLLLALDATAHATLLTDTPMVDLVVEDEAVVGVGVGRDGGRRVLWSRHGVMLAAGGFERNADMRVTAATPGRAEWSMAPTGCNTGDAIRAAVDVGAATELMDEAWWCPVVEQPDGEVSFFLGLSGGIIIDQHGRRFADESLPYDQFGRALAADPARVPSHVVFDGRFSSLPGIAVPPVDPAGARAADCWVSADTLAGLANLIGVDPATLRATVEEFNEAAATGQDAAFHRGEQAFGRFFGRRGEGPNPALVPVDQPPFTAARVVLGDLGTKGGLVTDADGRVLDEAGQPIRGLYATSNTVASLTRDVYPGPGIPLGTSMVFGYRAAHAIAARTDAGRAG